MTYRNATFRNYVYKGEMNETIKNVLMGYESSQTTTWYFLYHNWIIIEMTKFSKWFLSRLSTVEPISQLPLTNNLQIWFKCNREELP